MLGCYFKRRKKSGQGWERKEKKIYENYDLLRAWLEIGSDLEERMRDGELGWWAGSKGTWALRIPDCSGISYTEGRER